MIPINLNKISGDLSDEWLQDANNKTQNLVNKTPEERKSYINDNGGCWSKVREFYWRHGGKKCWYSEEILSYNEAQLEHFRPKNKVANENHNGYWWLAFDWRNYRIASSIVNVRKTDIRNGYVQGKGTYFPLVSGSRANDYRPTNRDPLSIGDESALLLDPTVFRDTTLLQYKIVNGYFDGKIHGNPENYLTDNDKDRAEKSIGFYQLNDGKFIDKRNERYTFFIDACEELEELESIRAENGVLSEKQLKKWVRYSQRISNMIASDAEFSSLCRATLESFGNLGWNHQLLNSVKMGE
ncbi:hypothetical protein VCSRO179_0074 [Vibrio cholerae]|nr:hypothetical protein VCSRO179_0074 [Vibrio cholerae]